MNKKQSTVLWIGIAVFVLIALTTTTAFKAVESRMVSGGRRPPENTYIWVVDYGPLVGRLISIVIVTGGLIYTLKDKKDEKPKDEKKQ